MLKKYLIYILLVIAIVPSVFSLLHPGFFLTDDGNWMIIRFASFYQTLRSGQFPVRFLPSLNHGYGYPVADFLYPGFLYLGVPIHILGFGFVTTIKIIAGASLLFSGLFCFLWLKKLFSSLAAFAGAVVYVLFPYHLFDLYQRGSIGELLALAIVPFIFWQIEKKNLLFISLGIAGLILAHNSLALLFLPVIFLYMFLIEKIRSINIAYIFLYALGLSAFFWIPALYDKQFTIFDNTPVSDISHYFLSTQTAGLAGILVPVVFSMSSYFYFKKQSKHIVFFFILILLAGLFTLSISHPLWKILHLSQLVQFPFRFLSLVILGMAYLTAFALQETKKQLRPAIFIGMILLTYISAWSYLFPKTVTDYPDDFYATNQDTTTVQNEYMPRWVKHIPTSLPEKKVATLHGRRLIQNLDDRGTRLTFHAVLEEPSAIQISTIYFPGWKVFANKKEINIFYNNEKGVIQILLGKGNYEVQAIFTETPVRLFSDVISLVSLIYLLGYGVFFKKYKRS